MTPKSNTRCIWKFDSDKTNALPPVSDGFLQLPPFLVPLLSYQSLTNKARLFFRTKQNFESLPESGRDRQRENGRTKTGRREDKEDRRTGEGRQGDGRGTAGTGTAGREDGKGSRTRFGGAGRVMGRLDGGEETREVISRVKGLLSSRAAIFVRFISDISMILTCCQKGNSK